MKRLVYYEHYVFSVFLLSHICINAAYNSVPHMSHPGQSVADLIKYSGASNLYFLRATVLFCVSLVSLLRSKLFDERGLFPLQSFPKLN